MSVIPAREVISPSRADPSLVHCAKAGRISPSWPGRNAMTARRESRVPPTESNAWIASRDPLPQSQRPPTAPNAKPESSKTWRAKCFARYARPAGIQPKGLLAVSPAGPATIRAKRGSLPANRALPGPSLESKSRRFAKNVPLTFISRRKDNPNAMNARLGSRANVEVRRVTDAPPERISVD